MPNKSEITEQCGLAFDFIQKLYLEVSYLIKEIEGILGEHDFVIGRPSGYQISARSSSGLEPSSVNLWLLKRFAVFFAPKDEIVLERGQTKLSIENPTKALYLRIILNDTTLSEPTIYSGVLYDIQKQPAAKKLLKFEQAMQHIQYNDEKIFKSDLGHFEYEDAYIRLKGELVKNSLFEIDSGETIRDLIVVPSLKLYEKH